MTGCGATLALALAGEGIGTATATQDGPQPIGPLLNDMPDNWGRFGDDDELGAINFLGGQKIVAGMEAVTNCDILTRRERRGFLQGKARCAKRFRNCTPRGSSVGVPGSPPGVPWCCHKHSRPVPSHRLLVSKAGSLPTEAAGDVGRRKIATRSCCPPDVVWRPRWCPLGTPPPNVVLGTPPANAENRGGHRRGTSATCTPGSLSLPGYPLRGLCPRCVR